MSTKLSEHHSKKALYQPYLIEPFKETTVKAKKRNFVLNWENDLELSWLCSNLSHLAYFKSEAIEQHLYKVGMRFDSFFIGQGSTECFLAYDANMRFAVISFRGTENDKIADLRTDAKFFTRQINGVGCVHQGFDDGVDEVWGSVSPKLQKVVRKGIPLILTGHSLGASLSTITSSRVPGQTLVTLGSPRTGDKDFVNNLNAVRILRWVNSCDLVTMVPPDMPGFDYHHTRGLHFLTNSGKLIINPSNKKIRRERWKARFAFYSKLKFLGKDSVKLKGLVDHAIVNYSNKIYNLKIS